MTGDMMAGSLLPRLDELAPDRWIGAVEAALAPGTTADLLVETRPAPGHNPTRPSVFPIGTWTMLVASMGLDVLEATPVPTIAPAPDPTATLAHWNRFDPFRDAGGAWILRVRRPGALAAGNFERTARHAGLVVAPTGAPDGPRVAFLIGSAQDFHLLLPVIEALPAHRRQVWVRHGAATPDAHQRRSAIMARLTALGLAPLSVGLPQDADWTAVDVLVTASESTANSDHLLNAAFVVTANTRGVRTCQLQHGIVPLADFAEPIVWFSREFHAWSRGLAAEVGRLPRESGKRIRAFPGAEHIVTGCPKFDRYAPSAPITAADVFGDWAAQFRRTVLVATNLHWGQHRAGGGVWDAVRAAIHANPDDLFVVKLHPVETPPEELVDARPHNVVLVDERVALYGGIDTTRLVRASDVVICTLSTVALEAALASKPFVVLDTGNPNVYRHVATTPVAELAAALAAPPNIARTARRFADAYIARATVGRATASVLSRLDAPAAAGARSFGPGHGMGAFAAFAALAAQRDAHAAALEAGKAETDVYVASLRETIEEKDRYCTYLLGAVEALKKRARPA